MGKVKLLRASAGSGKTWRLAYEYVRAVIEDPLEYAHILAVTFTNKATAEMKQRIVAEINALSQGDKTDYLARLHKELNMTDEAIRRRATTARTRILHDYSHFSVLTIDKFFQRIIRSFVRELGIDIKVTLELRTSGLLASAVDRIVDEISLNDALRAWVLGFVDEKIEESRHWDIKRELMALGGEIFHEDYRRHTSHSVSKEQLKAIVERVSARADEIISYARKKAEVPLQILADNNLQTNDLKGGKSSFANYLKKVAAGDLPEPGIMVLKAADSDEEWSSKTSPRRAEILALAPTLRPHLQQLTQLYDEHYRFLNSAEIVRRNYRNFALLTDLADRMEAICASENILPIAQTNNLINRLVSGNDAPFIFEKAGNHFTRMMIDEFQDTSTMQWQNFLPLLENSLAQSDGSPVLLVGDVKQSIYRWRGGDWRILGNQIERIFESVDAENLDTNYRSFENIVKFNNDIIARCVALDNDTLNNILADAQEVGDITQSFAAELTNTLAHAYEGHEQLWTKGTRQGWATITERDDLAPVIERIEDLQRRGFSAGDIAILVRTGREGIEIANALLEHKRKNPNSSFCYDVVTQEALLVSAAPVTAFVLACYKLAINPNDALQRAIFNRWQGREVGIPLYPAELAQLREMQLLSPEEAFEKIVETHRLGRERTNVAYLQAIQDQVLTFGRMAIGDLRLFVLWWDENSRDLSLEIPDAGRAITVSTIHKAKGLQYRAVIIPWCNWSLVPQSRSVVWADASGVDSELADFPMEFGLRLKGSSMAAEYYRELVMTHVDNINILYVALTRAEEELHIMMPREEKKHGDRIDTLVLEAAGDMREFGQPVDNVVKTDCSANDKVTETDCDKTGADTAKNGGDFVDFESFTIADRLRLRRPSERYGTAPSARDYGIMMHRVFENATDYQDISTIIEAMLQDGVLSPTETEKLRQTVRAVLVNPTIRSWFDGSWDVVRRENSIIVPAADASTKSNLKRPDRVMIRGNEAVVVDYKFGLARPEAHKNQIREYARLLQRMGYNNVSGYVWYVSLGDVECVV